MCTVLYLADREREDPMQNNNFALLESNRFRAKLFSLIDFEQHFSSSSLSIFSFFFEDFDVIKIFDVTYSGIRSSRFFKFH